MSNKSGCVPWRILYLLHGNASERIPPYQPYQYDPLSHSVHCISASSEPTYPSRSKASGGEGKMGGSFSRSTLEPINHTIALRTSPGRDPSPVPVLESTGRSGLASPPSMLPLPWSPPTPPPAPRKFRLPIRLTMLLPTASTAPRGLLSVGPDGAMVSTRKSLMAVPFQTPTVPFGTCISATNAKDQRRDSYQPRLRGDHSKYWMRMGEGSMPAIRADWMVERMDGDGVSVEVAEEGDGLWAEEMSGESWPTSVSTV